MSRSARVVVGMCVVALLRVPSAAASGPPKKTSIPFTVVATLLGTAFEGTSIHLNNYQPSGVRAGDAFVQLGPNLGGGRIRLTLPELSTSLPFPIGVIRLTVNDVNSKRLGIAYSGGAFVVTIDFEGNGTELIVRSDAGMPLPDVEVDSGRLALSLRPGPDASGRPSFSSLTAAFAAEYRCTTMGSICDGLLGFVRPSLDALLQDAVGRSLNTPELRNRVGQALVTMLGTDAGRAAVEAATHEKIGTFRGAHYEASGLVIEHD
jgi:hypothetical protein